MKLFGDELNIYQEAAVQEWGLVIPVSLKGNLHLRSKDKEVFLIIPSVDCTLQIIKCYQTLISADQWDCEKRKKLHYEHLSDEENEM